MELSVLERKVKEMNHNPLIPVQEGRESDAQSVAGGVHPPLTVHNSQFRESTSTVRNPGSERGTIGSIMSNKTTRGDLLTQEFYKRESWVDDGFEVLFKIKERETSIGNEVYCGLIHFISCLYCLAVVPQQLKSCGYSPRNTVVSTSALCGIGSILVGLFANLPFVLAPPTVVTIFLANYIDANGLDPNQVIIKKLFIESLEIKGGY